MSKDKGTQHLMTRIFVGLFGVVLLTCGCIMIWVGTQGSASVKDTGHYMGAAASLALGGFAIAAVIVDIVQVGDIMSVRGSIRSSQVNNEK